MISPKTAAEVRRIVTLDTPVPLHSCYYLAPQAQKQKFIIVRWGSSLITPKKYDTMTMFQFC